MTGNEYQQGALLTAKGVYHQPDKSPPLCIAMLGLAGEAGEVADEYKKVLEGKRELDPLKLMLELGDVLWYVAIIAHLLEIPLEDIMQANLNKVEARHLIGLVQKDKEQLDKSLRKDDSPEQGTRD